MSGPLLVAGASLAVTPWKNGAGRKADIAAGSGWTLGYAWLDGDAPFSDYAGHDRTITLIHGPGFVLETTMGAVAVRVDAEGVPASFDGGARLFCRVLGGPCRVLNVMTSRDTWVHRVEVVSAGPVSFQAPREGTIRAVVATSGPLSIRAGAATKQLAALDALIFEPGSIPEQGIELDVESSAALFEIAPKQTCPPNG